MVKNGIIVKSLPALLRGITSNQKEDFYCLNCFHSYSTKNKLKKHEKVCNDHDYYVEMPNEDNKILKYNHEEKSLKALAIIYGDLECLLEECIHVKIILKNLTQKKNKHKPSGYSLFTNCSFDAAKNKVDCYRCRDYMEKCGKDLREHGMKIIYYEKKKRNDTAN